MYATAQYVYVPVACFELNEAQARLIGFQPFCIVWSLN